MVGKAWSRMRNQKFKELHVHWFGLNPRQCLVDTATCLLPLIWVSSLHLFSITLSIGKAWVVYLGSLLLQMQMPRLNNLAIAQNWEQAAAASAASCVSVLSITIPNPPVVHCTIPYVATLSTIPYHSILYQTALYLSCPCWSDLLTNHFASQQRSRGAFLLVNSFTLNMCLIW